MHLLYTVHTRHKCQDVWFYILNARQWATIAVAPGHDSWLYTIYSELYYIKNNMTVTGHYDYN